jgi:hypothetical protein
LDLPRENAEIGGVDFKADSSPLPPDPRVSPLKKGLYTPSDTPTMAAEGSASSSTLIFIDLSGSTGVERADGKLIHDSLKDDIRKLIRGADSETFTIIGFGSSGGDGRLSQPYGGFTRIICESATPAEVRKCLKNDSLWRNMGGTRFPSSGMIKVILTELYSEDLSSYPSKTIILTDAWAVDMLPASWDAESFAAEGKCQSMETGKYGNHRWMGGPVKENSLMNDYETVYGTFGIYCDECGQEAYVSFDFPAEEFIGMCQFKDFDLRGAESFSAEAETWTEDNVCLKCNSPFDGCSCERCPQCDEFWNDGWLNCDECFSCDDCCRESCPHLWDAESFGAESAFDRLEDEVADEYEEKGMSDKEAQKVGAAVAYKQGVKKYGKKIMSEAARKGVSAKSLKRAEIGPHVPTRIGATTTQRGVVKTYDSIPAGDGHVVGQFTANMDYAPSGMYGAESITDGIAKGFGSVLGIISGLIISGFAMNAVSTLTSDDEN